MVMSNLLAGPVKTVEIIEDLLMKAIIYDAIAVFLVPKAKNEKKKKIGYIWNYTELNPEIFWIFQSQS